MSGHRLGAKVGQSAASRFFAAPPQVNYQRCRTRSEVPAIMSLGLLALRNSLGRRARKNVLSAVTGSQFNAVRGTSAFSTAVSTPYQESWHQREAALQERLEVYKTPLTREEEGLRFQIKHVSNRDVSEREIKPRSS